MIRSNLEKWTLTISLGVTLFLVTVLLVFSCGCQQTPAPPPTETAGTGAPATPGATDTVTITPETPTPTPEVSAKPTKAADLAPYTLSKGRRDPFVPFGTVGPQEQTPAPQPTITTTASPTGPTPPPAEIGRPITTQGVAMPSTVPVQVTGTFVSGGKNWAIITSSSGGGPSFMVSSGDKVGEYVVKSVDSSKVVLVWSGKEYVLKIQTFGPYGSPKGAVTPGEAPTQKTLPAPERPKGHPGGQQPQMMPPPPPKEGGAPGGGSVPGGGTGEGAKTETQQ